MCHYYSVFMRPRVCQVSTDADVLTKDHFDETLVAFIRSPWRRAYIQGGRAGFEGCAVSVRSEGGCSGALFTRRHGGVAARRVLFVGEKELRELGYSEIREFARK